MKLRAIAVNTFRSFLRNKLILLFCALFLCVVLLFSTPLISAKAMRNSMSAGQVEGMVASMIGAIMSLVSGFGSMLAAWAAADTVGAEIKSGTILAVMARPVRRWEFLLGKYLGVLLLMSVYVVFLVATSYLFAWLGGQQIHSSVWPLVLYPLVRYAIYGAMAMFLAARMHPVVAFGITAIVSVVANIISPGSHELGFLPRWAETALYDVLPSTGLLSEERFLMITHASIKTIPWSEHFIALAYGLDYALVFFLLAVWLFRRRSLTRE